MRTTFDTSTLVLATIASACFLPRALAAERDHDVTIDDYFSVSHVSDAVISPDGRYVAYVEHRWEPPAEKRNPDLWVVECATKNIRRLTFDKAGDGGAQWSPDGQQIYFTSNPKRGETEEPPYDGKKQVWRIAVGGGEMQPVTRVKDGVGQFELARGGNSLYYTTEKKVVEEEWKKLREEYEDLEYGHGVTKFSQVWRLDLGTWRAEKLIDENRVIRALAVAPDESRIAMLTTPDENLLSNEGWSRLDVYDAKSKKTTEVTPPDWRKVHPSPYGWLDSCAWSGDGRALAFTVSFDGYPTRLYVAEWNGEAPAVRELDRPQEVTVAGGTVKWRGDSRDLCFVAEQRAFARVWCLADVRDAKQGAARALTPEEAVAAAMSFSSKGDRFAVVLSATTHLPDVFVGGTSGEPERLTDVNPQTATWRLPQIRRVSWKGANGDDVEGILELPPDYKEGQRLPMVVELHGGPTAATPCDLRFNIYGRLTLPAKGYAVLSPNYRGSTGYGDRFMTDLVGRENDIEVQDILAGVDAMVERGIADPDRLGVMGWSNGGFLTNCVITKSDRFKAASTGAGVLDMVIQWGTEDTPGHVINYMQGLPWSKPDAYHAGSPMYRLDKVKTPTLIHVGGNDERVPPAHSRALYRALRHYVKTPVELVVYPGEGHGLTTYKSRKAKMEWDVAWFDRYLLGTTTPPPTPPSTN
ncbi:MAG: S9 family peptidase [Planctomycetes bacterium]|nr:S9 family peptidase [Planctomycetota bacterium]